MFFDVATTIKKIDYRIALLKEHGEVMNQHLIAKLLRQRRNLMKREENA